ncbi:MAG: Fe2+-dependent dioxygenase [Gammaproteobacteria bacterium]
MLLVIPDVLSQTKLNEIQSILAQASYVDGRLSAGGHAVRVKHNQELPPQADQIQRLNQLVMNTLVQHPRFQQAALPHRIASPFYARYTQGMTYGDHIDDPVMGPGPTQRYRSDISCTVFLNPPEAYDGGELVIQTTFGSQRIKLPAGHVVIYPSSSLHQVSEVIRGERLVAVTWIQSMVRDPARRELLYELSQARDSLMQAQPDADVTNQVDHSYVNLVRMWTEI